MQLTVQLTKYHLKGLLEGQRTQETMRFVDWDRACEWAGSVTENTECPYVVLEMRNTQTDQVECF
jgi:hypothetical protein